MKKITFTPKGVCSRKIDIEVNEEGIIEKIEFQGGCIGNLKGLAQLSVGRNIDEVIASLDGIKCGFKSTSCPDQLAKALKSIKE